jgi:hypothetical protein
MHTSAFDIAHPAPTQQVIDQRLAKQAKLSRVLLYLAAAGLAVMLLSFLTLWLSSLINKDHHALLSNIAGKVIVLSWMWMFLAMFIRYDVSTETPWAPIAQSDCPEMRLHCDSSDVARAYAASVIEQGRQFVQAELHMMQDARLENWEAAECKALYGVPVHPISV